MYYPVEWSKGDWHRERCPWADNNYLGNRGGEKLGHWRPVKGQRWDLIACECSSNVHSTV